MTYDNELTAIKLQRWKKYLRNYQLPAWEEIPDFGLYMEQVLSLLTEYLDYFPPELKEEQFITAATINNYVHKNFMPKPHKKRYYRVHIAYLIMICTLKQSMSITTLQKIIPMGIDDEEVKRIYTNYINRHKLTAEDFIQHLKKLAGPILYDEVKPGDSNVSETIDLITTIAVFGSLSRLLAEKLLLLEGQRVADQDPKDLEQ